jgi:hypothetical protein
VNSMEPTLLEKALLIPNGVQPAKSSKSLLQEVELAVAFLEGRVSNKQFCAVLKKREHNGVSTCHTILRRAISAELIRIVFPHQEKS